MTNPVNLLGYDRQALGAFLNAIGEKPYRARQILRWVHRCGEQDFSRMTDLPRALQEKLKSAATVDIPPAQLDYAARDGTRKWLLAVGNENAVETVFIPERTRGTLCVSSQVGCALACTFCSTGRQGFNRNLSAAEIIGQLWWANRAVGANPRSERVISNVVFMGMGEPLLNFENVVDALQLMLDDSAYGLSRRRVTVSTSGIVPAMDRLGQTCPVALAVSLHAPTDSLRDELVPVNKKYPLKELMQACRRYIDNAPRDFITFEYVMLQGINDSPACARELIKRVKTVPCKFNLIPFNPFPRSGYACSSPAVVKAFQVQLQEAGYIATVRKTRGEDIDAACGQLAGRVRDRTRRAERLIGVGA